MSQYRRILLVADPSMRRTPAFERAAWLAKATGAALHIGLFDHREAIAAAGLVDQEAMRLAKEGFLRLRKVWLDQEAEALRAQGIQVTAEAVWAHPMCDEIVQHAVESSADLVVKDVHLEPLLKRVLLKSLDWQLLRLCPAPLLLVNSVSHVLPRRVIAAVDPLHGGDQPSGFNDQIVRAALALAIQCDAELHLVHAFDGLSAFIATSPAGMAVMPNDLYEVMLDSHRQAFAALADAHGVPPERRHFLQGPAVTAISDFAAGSGADVIVLGTMRRSRLDRLMMGSTAESILDYAPCNVLAVKPEGFGEQLAASLAQR